MKIIDLLQRIANYDEPILKIKYDSYLFEFDGNTYRTAGGTSLQEFILDDLSNLNDEVEVIKEEPRDIEVCGSLFTKSEYDKLAELNEDKKIEKIKNKRGFTKNQRKIIHKINEIIDIINKEK